VGFNLSERENERGRRQNAEQGLDDRVEIVDGNFEDVPYADASFDLVWSQEAFLHSGDRRRVLEEAVRILRPGGTFIFSDPMRADEGSNEGLQPILDRLHLDTLGSPAFYRENLGELGLEEVGFDQRGAMIAAHYGRVREVLVEEEDELRRYISGDYIEGMKRGLQHWVDGGNRGDLTWGIFLFRKP
jgi:sarcosine/dimethylglycine N-methyltransferase